MNRREFLTVAGTASVAPLIAPVPRIRRAVQTAPNAQGDRAIWIALMQRLADPVLKNLANGTLKARMPVEQAARRRIARRSRISRRSAD